MFVSYSHADQEIAEASRAALEAAAVPCWIAPRDVVPGEGYPEQIVAAIGSARLCLLVLSERSNASRQVQSEIELAFTNGIPIVPYRIGQVEPTGNLRFLLAGTHRLNAGSDPRERIPELVEKTAMILERYARVTESAEDPVKPKTPIPEERTNLPFTLTPLVGRENDLAQIKTLLEDARLITIVGPGGVGKTRLSQQAGSELLEAFSDGVWFVDLATITDSHLVVNALADVLRIRDASNELLQETVLRSLRQSSLLFIMDNCEHVVDTVAHFSDNILRACPRVRILATSRQPLGITGEEVIRLPPLDDRSAVELFLMRARSVNKSFTVNAEANGLMSDICRRLDGIPLAIELAAARTKALSLTSLRDRLDERFPVLTGGSRTALPRHQTLAALIGWSYELLSLTEKTLFNRLGIFAGRFTVEAAAKVCGDGSSELDILDTLSSLVDKSLVASQSNHEGESFRMLESMRQFAQLRLTESKEGERLFASLVNYVVGFAKAAGRDIESGGHEPIARVEAFLDQIRAVLDAVIAQRKDIPSGLAILESLLLFWAGTGKYRDAFRWFTIALDVPDLSDNSLRSIAEFGAGSMGLYLDDLAHARELLGRAAKSFRETEDNARLARALNALGIAANYLGDHREAEDLFSHCLETYRAIGHGRGVASSLLNLGATAQQYQPNPEIAENYYRQCLAQARTLGQTSLTARVCGLLADIRRARGDLDEAFVLTEESLHLWRTLDNHDLVAESLRRLASCYLEQGHPIAARGLFREALSTLLELGDAAEIAMTADMLAACLARETFPAAAAEVLGFSERIRMSVERVISPDEERLRGEVAEALRAALGDEILRACIARGRALAPRDLLAVAANPGFPLVS